MTDQEMNNRGRKKLVEDANKLCKKLVAHGICKDYFWRKLFFADPPIPKDKAVILLAEEMLRDAQDVARCIELVSGPWRKGAER